jgi:hypothetical protein
LVESAVVSPISLLLIAVVNLGIVAHAEFVLTQASREGGRARATVAGPSNGDDEMGGAVRRADNPVAMDTIQIESDPLQLDHPRSEAGALRGASRRAHSTEYRARNQSFTLPLTCSEAIKPC